jgi:hypothetical protein
MYCDEVVSRITVAPDRSINKAVIADLRSASSNVYVGSTVTTATGALDGADVNASTGALVEGDIVGEIVVAVGNMVRAFGEEVIDEGNLVGVTTGTLVMKACEGEIVGEDGADIG